jgi:hypothetical protein
MPVNPPIVNINIKPRANNIGVSNVNLPPVIVASHENIFIPVGTAMIMVVKLK